MSIRTIFDLSSKVSKNPVEKKRPKKRGPLQWKKLIDLAPDFIFISRIDTFEFIEVSKRACDYYGYTRKEFLGMQIFDIEVNAPLVSSVRNLYKNTSVGEVIEVFGHNRRKDGTIFPVHVRFTKIDNEIAMANVRNISIIVDQANLEILRNRLFTKNTRKAVEEHKLSSRESEILLLIGKAMGNAQIADKLKINVKTVSTYRARLLQKLGLKNNTELAQYAANV